MIWIDWVMFGLLSLYVVGGCVYVVRFKRRFGIPLSQQPRRRGLFLIVVAVLWPLWSSGKWSANWETIRWDRT